MCQIFFTNVKYFRHNDKNILQIVSSGYKTHPIRLINHGGVVIQNQNSYPRFYTITFSLSVITTHLWRSVYSDYQVYLYTQIKTLKECNLTPLGYRRISHNLNERGLKSPYGKTFTNVIVYGIYQKGKVREERLNRSDEIRLSEIDIKVIL